MSSSEPREQLVISTPLSSLLSPQQLSEVEAVNTSGAAADRPDRRRLGPSRNIPGDSPQDHNV